MRAHRNSVPHMATLSKSGPSEAMSWADRRPTVFFIYTHTPDFRGAGFHNVHNTQDRNFASIRLTFFSLARGFPCEQLYSVVRWYQTI